MGEFLKESQFGHLERKCLLQDISILNIYYNILTMNLSEDLSCEALQGCKKTQPKAINQKQMSSTGFVNENLNMIGPSPDETQLDQSDSIEHYLSWLFQLIIKDKERFQLLDDSIFSHMENCFSKSYFSESQKKDLMKNLAEYLQQCRERMENAQPKKVNADFFKRFGENVFRIQNRAYFDNKSILKLIGYMSKSPDKYGCYLDLKFELEEEEALSVAAKTREFYKQDEHSFFFLSFYLYKSCLNLEKKQKSLKKIEEILTNILIKIQTLYPAAPPLPISEELLLHKSTKLSDEQQKFDVLNLKGIEKSKRRKAMEDFVYKKALEAMANNDKFASLLDKTCREKGTHLKVGVKVKNRQHKRAIDRVIEKLIKKEFKKFTPEAYSKELAKGETATIQSYMTEEKRRYELQMDEIYSHIEEPIPFKVSDMLRGKCLYQSVSEINNCVSNITDKLNKEGYKLLELDNRLHSKTSDIVFKILVDNTVTELQLPIEFNIAYNQFDHKIYEIKRSNFHSPFTMLKLINQEISSTFSGEFLERFRIINKFSTHQEQKKLYNSQQTFASLEKPYNLFLELIEYKVAPGIIYHPFDENIKAKIVKTLAQCADKTLSPEQTEKIHRNNGQFYQSWNLYKKATEQYTKYLQILNTSPRPREEIDKEREIVNREMGDVMYLNGKLNESLNYYQLSLDNNKQRNEMDQYSIFLTQSSIANVYQQLGKYQESLDHYNKCLKIQEKINKTESLDMANTLKGIATVEQEMGSYKQALEHFFKCLRIEEKLIGKDKIQSSSTLRGIGAVYKKQKKNEDALLYYNKCFQIEERVKGKGAFESSTTLRGLGNIYLDMKNYDEAFDKFNKCLEIKEKVKGVGSIDTAAILNNIADLYQEQGKLDQALKYYAKCLDIKIKFKGKQSIDTASTMRGKGIVYEKQGLYAEALDLFQKSLTIKQTVKGKGSIDTAPAIQSIGNVMHDLKDYDEALRRYKQVREIYVRVMGENSKQVQQVDKRIVITVLAKY